MSLSDYTYRYNNLVPRVRFSLPLEVGCPTSKAREKRSGDKAGRIIAAPRLIASLDRIITPLAGNIENNPLPRIISHPHLSRHLFFFLSPPCRVEVESDAAKLISEDSSSDAEDIDTEN